jgi:hypothetical protein
VKRLTEALLALASLSGYGMPETGDRVSYAGKLVKPPRGWVGPPVGLEATKLLGGFVYLQGDLGDFEPGDRVRVEGTFFEYSIYMRSVIQVEKVTRGRGGTLTLLIHDRTRRLRPGA